MRRSSTFILAALIAAACTPSYHAPVVEDVGHRPTEVRQVEAGAAGASAPAPAPRPVAEQAQAPTATPAASARPATARPAASASALPAPKAEGSDPLVLGEFLLADKKPIIDGDTIRVSRLDATLRLLCIDTEETFKNNESDRTAADIDFAAYARMKHGDGSRPAKYATPLGEEAARFAEDFFSGHSSVRLEYDDMRRRRGYYDRHLVYVFAWKDGRWINYNLESVRAGMSPYFTKYGRSMRFHAEFEQAQAEARAAKRGIWAPGARAYPDYEARLAWWNKRADRIDRFRRVHAGKPDHLELGGDDTWDRLLASVGKTVTVFGIVGGEIARTEPPFIITLSHQKGKDFTVVAFDRPALDRLQLLDHAGEYVYLRGKITEYRGRPQFLAKNVEKVWAE